MTKIDCDGFSRVCDHIDVRDYTMSRVGKTGRRAVSLCFACAKSAMAHGYTLKAVAIVVDEQPRAMQR